MILLLLTISADGRLIAARVIEGELEVLMRVAKRLTQNEAEAEDAVSQTIIIALERWNSFDGRHPRSWLIQILRNEWLQALRKRKVRRESSYDQGLDPAAELFWGAVDDKLEAEMIHRVIDELAEEYRLAVTLCDVEQLTYEEAARALEVPVGTLQSRLFRARKMLRTKLVHLSSGANR